MIFDLGVSLPPVEEVKGASIGIWPIAHNAPVTENDEVLTYDALAELSSGQPALGVLRADVDNLGSVFREGLDVQEASLSRLASISWHLTLFFSGYVGQLIQESERFRGSTQVVFSGGDDLFIAGAWDVLPSLSRQIRNEFREFAASNHALTLSAGIVLGGPNEPVITLADSAHEAEDRAKKFDSRVGGRSKDAVNILGRTVTWEELQLVETMASDLAQLCSREGGGVPRSLLQRLLAIAEIEHQSRRKRSGESIDAVKERAELGRWAWMTAYSMVRVAERHPHARGKLYEIRDSLAQPSYGGIRGERHVIEYLEVPTRWAFIVTRKSSSRGEDSDARDV